MVLQGHNNTFFFFYTVLFRLLLLLLLLFFSHPCCGVWAQQHKGAAYSAIPPSNCSSISSNPAQDVSLPQAQIWAPKRVVHALMYESDAGGPRLQVQHDNRAAALDVWVVGREYVASNDKKGWRKKRIGWGGFVPLLSSEAVIWTEAEEEEEEEEEGGGEGAWTGTGTGMMRMMRMRMRMKKMRERRSYSSGGKYWCVARPWAEADMVQAALDWACSHSAECRLIQLAQPCYVPNTLLSHASFAFNSYFQIHGQASGTCDFGGTAMITNIDPSYPGCNYPFRAGQVGAPISRGMASSRLRRGATLGMLIAWFLLLSFWIP